MDQEFFSQALSIDNKTFSAIRPQSDDLTNDPITRDLYGSEVTFLVVTKGQAARTGRRLEPRRRGLTTAARRSSC